MTDPAAPANTRANWLVPVLALLAVAAVWLTTLQTSLGAPSEVGTHPMVLAMMDDAGEFVIAWNTWGVVHPPGYPLLALVANLVTLPLRLVGVAPVVAASLVSWLFGVAALALVAATVHTIGRAGLPAASALLLPAFGGMAWLFSSVAESYALGMLFSAATLLLAVRVGQQPDSRTALVLGLVFGLMAGHHRTLLALAPALAWVAWPARKLGIGPWLGAAALAAASGLVYLYLPLVDLLGSPWVYGRSPATWPGFLDAVLATEYGGQLLPEINIPAIPFVLGERVFFLAEEMTVPGLVLGGAGVVLGLTRPDTRRAAVACALVALAYIFAPVGQFLLIGTHMLIMTVSLALAVAWGIGLVAASRWRFVAPLGLTLSVGVAVFAATSHWDYVTRLSQNDWGQRIRAEILALPDPNPTIVELWSPRYYSLYYDVHLSRTLAHVNLIDARYSLENLPPLETLSQPVLTTPEVLLIVPPERWQTHLDAPLAFSAAAEGLVQVCHAPCVVAEPPTDPEFQIALIAAEAWREGDDLRLTLTWQATTVPGTNYSVFVHVSEQPAVATGDDILIQGDRLHPVYSLYPTSQWQPGEVVGDHYRIPLPPGSQPQIAVVGLYSADPATGFTNHLVRTIPIR